MHLLISLVLSPRRYSTSFDTGTSSTSSSSSSSFDDFFFDDFPSSSSSCNNCTTSGKTVGIAFGGFFGAIIAIWLGIVVLGWICGYNRNGVKYPGERSRRFMEWRKRTAEKRKRDAWAGRQEVSSSAAGRNIVERDADAMQGSVGWWLRKWRRKQPDVEKGQTQTRSKGEETRGLVSADVQQKTIWTHIRRVWSNVLGRLGVKTAENDHQVATAAENTSAKAHYISKAEAAVAKPEAVAIAMSGSNLESWNRGHS